MSVRAIEVMNERLAHLNINYEFGTWTSEVVYPYFVGEYQEVQTLNEDGMSETIFILNGFTRGNWIDLEIAKSKIENYFGRIGGHTVIVADGSAVAVFYNDAQIIPTGDAELKRMQINLTIKEWKVE